MKLTEGKEVNIRYMKTGELTERTIIPTTVPISNIKALDVTHLTEEQRATLARQHMEYRDYVRSLLSTVFKFEDWLEHTNQLDKNIEIKWRTFKPEQTEILD